jgi:hypothetical protein
LRPTPPSATQRDAVSVTPGEPAYDDGLVQRCRDLWRRGDWSALLEIPLDDVERHPRRARLALMVASAHLALGQHAKARTLAGLALQWGCEHELVARVLLAGVHNTLGRAAVASGKLRDHALAHFAQAVEPGGPRSLRRLALQARVQEQLRQMQMEHEAYALLSGPHRTAPTLPVPTPLRELREGMRQQTEKLLGAMTEQNHQMTRLQRHVDESVGREVGNAVRQLEAHARIQRFLGPDHQMPELHGWPISADFGALLLDLLDRHDYDLILEFGSGASTVLMAAASKRHAAARAERGLPPTMLLALEHLPEYQAQTASMLQASHLETFARVALAPIQPFITADGRTFPYYDARDAVGEAVSSIGRPAPDLKVLLMVDGPPAATGPRARYPALPLALEFLAGARLDILLDDYRREDEKQVAQDWLDDLRARGLDPSLVAYPLEKEACLIRS